MHRVGLALSTALIAVVAIAGAPSTGGADEPRAETAKTTLKVVRGPAVQVEAITDQEDLFDVYEDGFVNCGEGRTPLAPAWSGAPVLVSSADPDLGTFGTYSIDIRRPRSSGRVRPAAICAKGPVRATTKHKASGTVSCGKKLAIGVPVSSSSPFAESPVESRPVGRNRWKNTDADSMTSAICVSRRAFRRVQTLKRSKSFKLGQASAAVKVKCRGPRRPIGWGYALPLMAQNEAIFPGITNKRSVPFVSASTPAGKKAWKVVFRTADELGAKTAAKVTAYVTCAKPA